MDAAQSMLFAYSRSLYPVRLFQVSCQGKKKGKSACRQRRPDVLPAIPIEMSSLYLPEVRSSNLVKRIRGVKEKKKTDASLRTESRWPHRLERTSARPSEEREEEGIRKRETLHCEVVLGHV